MAEMEPPNYIGVDGLLEEVIQAANKAIPEAEKATFWASVSDKTDAMTAAVQKARENAWALGHGVGYQEGYDSGYQDGHTDQIQEEIEDA